MATTTHLRFDDIARIAEQGIMPSGWQLSWDRETFKSAVIRLAQRITEDRQLLHTMLRRAAARPTTAKRGSRRDDDFPFDD